MTRKAKDSQNPLLQTSEPEEANLLNLNEGNLSEEEEPEISVFRPDREGVRKVLGDLEADIMEYLWEKAAQGTPDVTVREVYEAFWQKRYVAYTTIMTTMARLARKHLLRAKKLENAYLYTPILSKAEFIDNFVARILENLLVSFSHTTENHLQRMAEGEMAERISALKSKVGKAKLKIADKAKKDDTDLTTPTNLED